MNIFNYEKVFNVIKDLKNANGTPYVEESI